jgi:hypothetical protein
VIGFERQQGPRTRAQRAPAVVSRPLTAPLDHLVTFLIRGYVPEQVNQPTRVTDTPQPRVCGAWIEALPELAAARSSPALLSAIRSLAVTLLSVRKVSPSSAWESYSFALGSLRDELRSASRSASLPSEIAAAIMCLLFSELHLNTTLRSWTAHLEGFAQLVRSAGPECFASGIPHKIFVGARPLLERFGSFATLISTGPLTITSTGRAELSQPKIIVSRHR